MVVYRDYDQFLHYFVRLDIKTFKWSPLKVGERVLKTQIPLKMVLSPDNVLILIESSNGRTVHGSEVTNKGPLYKNKFYLNGGHIHAKMSRIALR
jgi:hypothetical protein